MLAHVQPEMQQKARQIGGYREDEYINNLDINAYLFNYQKRGKVIVKPITVTEGGFEVKTIDEAINKLNSVSEDLYYMIKYGE